jgi:hypothetical protein
MAVRHTRHHPTVNCQARRAAVQPNATKRWEHVTCGTCKRNRPSA